MCVCVYDGAGVFFQRIEMKQKFVRECRKPKLRIYMESTQRIEANRIESHLKYLNRFSNTLYVYTISWVLTVRGCAAG